MTSAQNEGVAVPFALGDTPVELECAADVCDRPCRFVQENCIKADGAICTPKQHAQAREESEERYRQLFKSELHPLIVADATTWRVIEANQAALKLYGIAAEEVANLGLLDLTGQPEESRASIAEAIAKGKAHVEHRWHLKRDGSRFPVEISMTCYETENGNYLFIYVRDNSERIAAEQALKDSEAHFRGLAELAADYYWEQDGDLRFSVLTSSRLPWLVPEDHRGRTFTELPGFVPMSDDALLSLGVQLERREPFRDFDYGLQGRDGQTYYLRCSGTPVYAKDGAFVGYRGMGQDVTVQRRGRILAEMRARQDDLTGLQNRLAMTERCQSQIVAGRPFTLLLIDLDRFKVINDSLGHHTGDELLRDVADRFSTKLLPSRVYRLGGDEFVVLIEGEDASGAVVAGAVETILADIEQPIEVGGIVLNTGCSIGGASFPEDGESLSEVLRNADMAMYRAKRNPGSSFCRYSSAMQSAAVKRLHLERDIREAFAREQLDLHYQPRVCVQSGRVVGMEALLRWWHPERGPISPVDFIPIAEETGLILPIGKWALERACSQAREWKRTSRAPISIAVNVSARQFHQGLVGTVQEVLYKTGLNPGCLELEITESALMEDIDETIAVLDALTAIGVRLALDDFGTGYSSLTHLRRFPLEVVKLDRSFVSGIAESKKDAVIVESVITMAHSLGLRVVAEGVESAGQLQVLRQMGCDEFQGYLVSAAVPAVTFEGRFLVPANGK